MNRSILLGLFAVALAAPSCSSNPCPGANCGAGGGGGSGGSGGSGGGTPVCSVASCEGCCDASGVCRTGLTAGACGFGKVCAVCAGPQVCAGLSRVCTDTACTGCSDA